MNSSLRPKAVKAAAAGLRHPVDDGGSGCQWHEEGKTAGLVDEQCHLRLPEQHAGMVVVMSLPVGQNSL
jgi:hypothetical protein